MYLIPCCRLEITVKYNWIYAVCYTSVLRVILLYTVWWTADCTRFHTVSHNSWLYLTVLVHNAATAACTWLHTGWHIGVLYTILHCVLRQLTTSVTTTSTTTVGSAYFHTIRYSSCLLMTHHNRRPDLVPRCLLEQLTPADCHLSALQWV